MFLREAEPRARQFWSLSALVVAALVSVCLIVAGCSTSPAGPDDGGDSEEPRTLFMSYVPQYWYDPPGTVYVYVDGIRDRAWSHQHTSESALVVIDTLVRTMSHVPPTRGWEYAYDGTLTGRAFTCVGGIYDAGSDGVYIYAWYWFEATLVRFDSEWDNGEALFSLPFEEYSKAYMGITYDPGNDSIWLSSWHSASFRRLDNYSLTGELLRSIALGSGYGAGLARDPVDGTLWFFDWSDERYEGYNTDGDLLGTLDGMSRIYGAEFAPQ